MEFLLLLFESGFETKLLPRRIDGAIRVRSNVDSTFDSLMGSSGPRGDHPGSSFPASAAPSIAFCADPAPALPDLSEIPVGLSPVEIAQLHRETEENAAQCGRLLQEICGQAKDLFIIKSFEY
ncbi:hypothetical protein HAX54_024155 [Datura stramonium]|uniref:Uncharacterized protein ycf68 n=1 Tax=Datura stramonium TaxID=4076 RepID=A0ABS8S5C2_DATST|nr:hypothetical protein [Datura stramonium]